MHLDDLAAFVRIAELGTLSALARERNVPVSQVTRGLSRLEAACGARLLHRSTHGLSLTDEGHTVLALGRRLLDTAQELQGELAGRGSGPSGWVRVGVSASMAEAVIAPSLVGLRERHPGIRIDIAVDDRVADMARDGLDLAIRTGAPQGELLVARQIGVASRSLYASPDYLARHGTPQQAEDLARHHLIENSRVPGMNSWQRTDGQPAFLVRGSARADNSAILTMLALRGVGITRIMDLVARQHVAAGQLVPLLQAQFDQEAVPIYAVMLQERHRLPKVRACLDYWAECIAAAAR